MNGDDTPTVTPLRIVGGVAAALLVGVLVVVSIGRLAGFAELADTLEGATWQWLALCAVGELGVFAGYAGVFAAAVAFEAGPAIGAGRALRVVLASFALTQLVGVGGAAGLAFVYWSLRQLGFGRAESGVRLIGLNTLVYFVFAALAWCAAAATLIGSWAPPAMTLPWLIGVPLVVAVAAYFTSPVRVDRWTRRDGRGAARRLLAIGVESASWTRRAVGRGGGPGVWWAVLYWMGDVLSLWAALRSFGATVAPAALVVAYATGYLAQSIPIPFVATGGVDAATTFTLTAVGVPVHIALPAVVAHRVFAFWIPLAPGIWSAVGLLRESGSTERRGLPEPA